MDYDASRFPAAREVILASAPPPPCDICGEPSLLEFGSSFGPTRFACDTGHTPVRSTVMALPVGFYLRTIAPVATAVPHAAGHPGRAGCRP